MKRFGKIVIALILVASILSGCSAFTDDQTERIYNYEELTIGIPSNFGDQSYQPWAAQLAFFYSYNSHAVFAIRKQKEEVEKEHPGMTALEYAQEYAEGTTLIEPVEEKDGMIFFCHTMTNDSGVEFTYLCSAYESTSYYWLVQCSCPSDTFEDSRAGMTKILRSVTVQ